MRKPSLLAGLCVAALVGCTSILGDFEVGAGGSSSGTGPDGSVCTECGGKCVDIQTDNANCGACGTACQGEKTCQAGKCACAADKAFCNNQCVTASRTACGETCTPCQADEVCNAGCVPAPLAGIKTPPRSPTGWTIDGKPLTIEVTSTGIPGAIYECRTGPDAKFSPTEPAWAPCDGADGKGTTHTPKPDTMTPEGTYRTEVRYRSDTFRSEPASVRFYVHHKLDDVATCPRANHPEDGPHFKDEQYFQEAIKFSSENPGIFPTTTSFAAPGATRNDDMFLTNPFIRITFKAIAAPQDSFGWPTAGSDYTANERSLRHAYVLNPMRNLLLVRRTYVHPQYKDCRSTWQVGDRIAKYYGPVDGNRGPRRLDCEAFVFNAHGAAICLGPNMGNTAPTEIAFDKHPWNGNLPPQQPTVGFASTTAGSTTVTITNVQFASYPSKDSYIEIYSGTPYSGYRWYKVVSVTSQFVAANNYTQTVTINEPAPAKVVNNPWYWSGLNSLVSTFVIPTGYTRLHEDSHNFATGVKPPGTPEPRTKCETAGCADGAKSYLTYLPP